MKRSNGLFLGIVVIATALAYLLDYAREAARQYAAENFNMTISILSLIISGLVFAAIAVWAVIQIRKQGFSLVLSGLIILLGLFIVALPFTDIRPLTALLPYGEYSNIIGSLWIVLGVLGLFGRRGDPVRDS